MSEKLGMSVNFVKISAMQAVTFYSVEEFVSS